MKRTILIFLFMVSMFIGPTQVAAQDETLAQTRAVLDQNMQAMDMYFSQWLITNGYSEPFVYYFLVMPGQTVTSNCEFAAGQPIVVDSFMNNAFYCSIDTIEENGVLYEGAIYIPVDTFMELLFGNVMNMGSVDMLNYLLIAISAHEFAHHLVDEISLQRGIDLPFIPNGELIADCFAGHWMSVLNTVEPLTYENITAMTQGMGIMAGAASAPYNSHGTQAQRQSAFLLGYTDNTDTHSSLASCMAVYYPEAGKFE